LIPRKLTEKLELLIIVNVLQIYFFNLNLILNDKEVNAFVAKLSTDILWIRRKASTRD